MKKELEKILKGIGYVIGGILGIGYLTGCTEKEEHIKVYTYDSNNSTLSKELDRLWKAYNNALWSDDKEKIMEKISELEKKL